MMNNKDYFKGYVRFRVNFNDKSALKFSIGHLDKLIDKNFNWMNSWQLKLLVDELEKKNDAVYNNGYINWIIFCGNKLKGARYNDLHNYYMNNYKDTYTKLYDIVTNKYQFCDHYVNCSICIDYMEDVLKCEGIPEDYKELEEDFIAYIETIFMPTV